MEVTKIDDLPQRRLGPRGVDWRQVCADVEKHDGAWCHLGIFSASTVSHIRAGKYPSVDPEKFEVTSQRGDDGKRHLYMRMRRAT
jgi:hypothetical protein